MSRDGYGECDGCGRGPRALVGVPGDLNSGIATQYLCIDCYWGAHIDPQPATERAHTEAHRRADNREARA